MTDRFELLEQVGKGGMGAVWKARDLETREVIALKLLYPHLAEEPEYVERLQREVEIASRVNSPYVVRVLGYGVRDGAPYMAMEYVDGPSLRDKLRRDGPMPWNGPSGAKELARNVARALAAAAGAVVIHRDIKPSNILLAPDGTAKLADFGISRAMDLSRLTGSSTLLGTPMYMAPEGNRDARSDFYALGVVLYEALVGVPPFTAESSGEVMHQHLTVQPDLSRIPDGEARALVRWLMQKRPERRPQNAQQLVAVLDGTGTIPFRPVLLPAGAGWGAIAAIAGVPLVIGGIVAGALLFRGGSGADASVGPSETVLGTPSPNSDTQSPSGGQSTSSQTPGPTGTGTTSPFASSTSTARPSSTSIGGALDPTETPTSISSPSSTPTSTRTATATPTWTPTPTKSPTPTATPTFTPTPTATPTFTPTPTPTPTPVPVRSYVLDVQLDKTTYKPGDAATFCYQLNPQTPFEFRFYKSIDGSPNELVVDWLDDGRGDCVQGVMGASGSRQYTFEAWADGNLLSRRILHTSVGGGVVTWALD